MRSWRFGPEAAGSHRPLEEGRPPVSVAGRAAGWGCTGSPSNCAVSSTYARLES